MTKTDDFCRILIERSLEHSTAVTLLFDNKLYGQIIAILRQELDSLVRAIFLLEQSDLLARNHYIEQTLSGIKWTKLNSRVVITDRQMVDLADTPHGWTKSVYKLGCAFIHLSPMVNYKNGNPFSILTSIEIDDIKQHLHHYHGFPLQSELNMNSVSPYLLRIFTKISSNLSYYINDLKDEKIGTI